MAKTEILIGHEQLYPETSKRDFFSLSNLYLPSFSSSNALHILRVLIGENQNNPLVV